MMNRIMVNPPWGSRQKRLVRFSVANLVDVTIILGYDAATIESNSQTHEGTVKHTGSIANGRERSEAIRNIVGPPIIVCEGVKLTD